MSGSPSTNSNLIPEFVSSPNPDLYLTGRYMVLDFETTAIDKGSALNPHNKLVMAAWKVYEQDENGPILISARYTIGDEYEQQALLRDLSTVDFIVAQNAKFELQWLSRCGYVIGTHPVYDTMVAEWVLSSNRNYRLDLDSLANRYKIGNKSRLIKLMITGGISPENIPRSLLVRYCLRDVSITQDVMAAQLRLLRGTRLLPIVYTRCLVTLALADIEGNGICLDPGRVQEEYERMVLEYAALQSELDAMCGGINFNSTKQLGEFLYDTLQFEELTSPRTGEPIRTKGNARKTDSATLAALVAKTEEQRKFLELRMRSGKVRAAISKTLDFFMGVCKEKNGIFYGELQQGRTKTGRLSSAGRRLQFEMFDKPKSCQFQNLPNQYKPLITTRHKDWLVAEVDGSQLEFRVGGHLGRDQQILSDIVHKEDIHSCTAKALTDAGEPTSRRAAKASTFKPMYGGTRGSPAVEAYCKFFAEKYHELNTAQRNWALEAADRKEIETEWGMRFYFPDVRVDRRGYIIGQQQVFNYPIQAFATAEIIPIALVFFWCRTRGAKLIITNTVHDSIVCEVPPDEIELFQLAAVKSLTEDVYDYLDKCYNVRLTVPLGVGMKFGTHWSESGYSDEDLRRLTQVLVNEDYAPVIDDGEVTVDIPLKEERRAA